MMTFDLDFCTRRHDTALCRAIFIVSIDVLRLKQLKITRQMHNALLQTNGNKRRLFKPIIKVVFILHIKCMAHYFNLYLHLATQNGALSKCLTSSDYHKQNDCHGYAQYLRTEITILRFHRVMKTISLV